MLLLAGLNLLGQKQQGVNKLWETKSAHPSEILDFTNSTIDDDGNIYLTGNHTASNGQIFMLLEKFDTDGIIGWSQQWVCSGCYAAFGVDLAVSNNFVYLTGVVQSSPSSLDFDIVVQKYNAATGQMIWTRSFDNGSPTEFPVDILVNSAGTVFVAGTTQQATEGYNMFIASISSAGVINWQKQYDYADFDETAVQLRLSGSYAIQLLGASGVNASNWEAALLSYDDSGVLVNTLRSAATGLDRNLPLSYHLDGNDLFVGGSKMNTGTGNVDAYLQKYAIGSSISQTWETPVDIDGRKETISGIRTAGNGLIMATGGTTNAQNDTWTWIQQFSASGSPVWRQLRAAAPAEDILSGRYFLVDEDGNSIIALNLSKTAEKAIHLAQYDVDGKRQWEVPLVSSETKAQASNLLVHNGKNVYVTGIFKDNTQHQFYSIHKLETYKRDITYKTDIEGKPLYVNDEVIIRFNPSVVNTSFVNNVDIQSGTVGGVINDTSLIAALDAELAAGGNLVNWRVFKIFNCLTTTETEVEGCMGKTVVMPKLWSALLLEIGDADVKDPVEISDNIAAMAHSGIKYAQPNFAVSLPSPPPPPPDDDFFMEQSSFFNSPSGTNIEQAWDLVDAAGSWENRSVNVALIDSGVRFQHEDFRCAGCQGIQPLDDPGQPSLVMQALAFETDFPTDLSTMAAGEQDRDYIPGSREVTAEGHGTRSAGIIAAIRNNEKGVAGIASGTNGADGIGLYSYRYTDTTTVGPLTAAIKALHYVLDCDDCIIPGVDCENRPNADIICLEIAVLTLNNPQIPTLIPLLEEVIELLYDAQYIMLTARGNVGGFALDLDVYPAVVEDQWMISVGASGTDGEIVTVAPPGEPQNTGGSAYTSNRGKNMDIIAPGIVDLVHTTNNEGNNTYGPFSGTSAALPHATGIAALLLYHHPTDLAQEDVERLLEYSATSIDASYSFANGWGRLNGGKALELIDPGVDNLQVVHVEIPENTMQVSPFTDCTQGCDVALLTEEELCDESVFLGVPKKYYADFSIDLASYSLNIAPAFSDTNKKRWWVRSSATNLYPVPVLDGGAYTFNPINQLEFEGEPQMNGTVLSGRIRGYAFDVTEAFCASNSLLCLGGGIVPSASTPVEVPRCHQGAPHLSFSFLATVPNGFPGEIILTSSQEVAAAPGFKATVFPNPTQGATQLLLQQDGNQVVREVNVQVTNTQGRVVYEKSWQLGIQEEIFPLPTESLTPGMYFVHLRAAQSITALKFIKQ